MEFNLIEFNLTQINLLNLLNLLNIDAIIFLYHYINMSSIVNLFSDFNDSTKTKRHKKESYNITPSLNQGENFKKYQKKIKKNLEEVIENVNSKEGFTGMPSSSQNNTQNNTGLTNQTSQLIENNSMSPSQEKTVQNLKSQYNSTLSQYSSLLAKMNQTASNYFNRTNSNNPYLNKVVSFTTGEKAYVTNMGVLKYIPSNDILNSIPSSNQIVQLDMSWNNLWSSPGAQIPTNPPLLSGTPLQSQQSLGNEGTNVYVNRLNNNPKSAYTGCYADNASSPLMTFVGAKPSSDASGSFTYNMCQQAAIDGGYQYFALQNVDNSTSKGYCAVSNNQTTATSLGVSTVQNGQYSLWNSNTGGQSGNTATLTNTGSLAVINSNGQSVYITPNSNAQPSNYLGCYADKSNRAMTKYNNGKKQYNLDQCQQAASDASYQFFGLQNSTSGTNAQCFLSNNFSQASEYGIAGNCTQISDGSWSGGGWSNAIYNTDDPNSNYYLILQDNGNMSINRGTGPNDNQGNIWSSNTNGKQKSANPSYAATKGKYGKNWIPNDSTLAAGDFIGSNSGNIVLMMQTDGNLVLYTFDVASNCAKMSDGNMGAGAGGNALYDILGQTFPDNISKLGYIGANSELHTYPSTNIKYANSYTLVPGSDSTGNDIAGASYSNATVSSCMNTCNNNSQCGGFTFTNNTCNPKTSGMYPSGSKQNNQAVSLYFRNKTPIKIPNGVQNVINNIDSVTYQNYIVGNNTNSVNLGLDSAVSAQKQELSTLEKTLNNLASQLSELTGETVSDLNNNENQLDKNIKGIGNYLKDIKVNNTKIKDFNSNSEAILQDSDLTVLKENQNYILWSILAVATVIISMNITKN